MRCSNCGEPIEEGRLFCLNCGQEVQWVPDYDSFGDYMVQEKLKKEKEQAEAAAARKRAAIAAENRRRKKAKKKRMILVSVPVFLFWLLPVCFSSLVWTKKITTILITRSAWQILHFPITNTKKAINL